MKCYLCSNSLINDLASSILANELASRSRSHRDRRLCMDLWRYRGRIPAAIAVLFAYWACTPDPQDRLFDAVTAVDREAVSQALERGADLSVMNSGGRTALTHAVAVADLSMVSHLTNQPGIDVDAVDSAGMTALMHAANLGRFEIVEHLVAEAGADITISDSEGFTAYTFALKGGHDGVARYLFATLSPERGRQWVDSLDGLRFREEPYLTSKTIALLPHAAMVDVEGESYIEEEIDGALGRWAYSEWNGQHGWLFNAHLSTEQIIPIEMATPYLAEHSTGRMGTDAGLAVKQEVLFLRDDRVRYTRTQYYFDGYSRRTHGGTYAARSDRVELMLGPGVERSWVDPAMFTPEAEGLDPPRVPGFTVVLVWVEALGGFLESGDYSQVIKGDSYELNREARQYQSDSSGGFDHVGYFAPQGGFLVGNVGPAGGVVFYDKGGYSDGWRYLEAAWSDQSDGIAWGPLETSVGGTGTGIGDGKSNSETIVAALGSGTYAARLCHDLELGGYDDWFLPSRDELDLMYPHLELIGGFPIMDGTVYAGTYWSSSESSKNAAWHEYIHSGELQNMGFGKDAPFKVRAIRAF